jgi:hypothetical protein
VSKEKTAPKNNEPKPQYDLATLMHMGFPFIPVIPEVKPEEKPKK